MQNNLQLQGELCPPIPQQGDKGTKLNLTGGTDPVLQHRLAHHKGLTNSNDAAMGLLNHEHYDLSLIIGGQTYSHNHHL